MSTESVPSNVFNSVQGMTSTLPSKARAMAVGSRKDDIIDEVSIGTESETLRLDSMNSK
jgi:hypothetical protein